MAYIAFNLQVKQAEVFLLTTTTTTTAIVVTGCNLQIGQLLLIFGMAGMESKITELQIMYSEILWPQMF